MTFTFEDKSEAIDKEIAKRRNKWRLAVFSDIDFDDVSQIIRIHIHKKWNLWDQTKPLENWVNTVISHQISNLIRNHYGNIAPPCADCKFNEGEKKCGYTSSGDKDPSCKLYANWLKKKKDAYHIKLAASRDDPDYIESYNEFGDQNVAVDYEKSASRLHEKMKKHLNPFQYRIYTMLYVDGKKDAAVAELMGYTTSEKNRSPGYKQLHNIKKNILEKVKKVLAEEDIIGN